METFSDVFHPNKTGVFFRLGRQSVVGLITSLVAVAKA